jgi:hypothetical protein
LLLPTSKTTFLAVGVEKDRESSIAQTILVYEYVQYIQSLKVLREIRLVYEMKRVEGMNEKEEDGRPGRPSSLFPERSVATSCRGVQVVCYISIFRCAGVGVRSRGWSPLTTVSFPFASHESSKIES